MVRALSWLIGYLLGNFLTAEVVAKRYAGRSASEIGTTGNPGMANIMAHVGFKAGILTLAGDLGKCILACVISWLLLRESGESFSGSLPVLYGGLGCTFGHDFPFWRKFRGGKGVATGCAAKVLYMPLPGAGAVIGGMLVVFATQYLCIAGIAIPVLFSLLMAAMKNMEAAAVGAVYVVLSVYTNRKSLRGIRTGETGKDNVLGAIGRKLGRKGKQRDGKAPGRNSAGRDGGTENEQR